MTKLTHMVKKRVTITIDKELDEKIRHLQVSLITNTNKNWSYSSVLSLIIDEGMKVSNHKTKSPRQEKLFQKHSN